MLREHINLVSKVDLEKEKPKKTEKPVSNKKNFSCPYGSCAKNYRSMLALNLHLKFKHNAGTQKEREAFAVFI